MYPVIPLPVSNPSSQQFVAEHFDIDGTERTLDDAAENINTLNPTIKILVYYDSMVQPKWYEDWSTINQTKYESWFVHDKYGSNYYHRVKDVAGTHFLMRPDLGLTPLQQYTSWSDYYAKRAQHSFKHIRIMMVFSLMNVTYNLSAVGCGMECSLTHSFQSGFSIWCHWGPNFLDHIQNVQQVLSNKPIVCNAWKWSTFCQNATHMMMWKDSYIGDPAVLQALDTPRIRAIRIKHYDPQSNVEYDYVI